MSLKLANDQFPLFKISILQCGLNDANGIVFENKIVDSVGNDLEEFSNKLLTLVLGDVGFTAQALPQFLGSCDNIGIGLRSLAFLC